MTAASFCPWDGQALVVSVVTGHDIHYEACAMCGTMWREDGPSGSFTVEALGTGQRTKGYRL